MGSERGNASITFTKVQVFECLLKLSLLLILFRRLPPIEVVVVKFPFVIETRDFDVPYLSIHPVFHVKHRCRNSYK